MLIRNTAATRAALRRAVEFLDVVDDGSLVEVTECHGAIRVVEHSRADGTIPVSADEVVAASFGSA